MPDATRPGSARQRYRVLFVSQRRAERMRPPRAAAIISITDPGRPEAQLDPAWGAVLRLSFHDVDALTFPGQDGHLQEMSSDQVVELARFVAEHSRACRRWVVHCRHGVSRSAAVAKAIAEALGAPFPQDYREYNRFVHAVLRRPLRVGLGGS